MMPCILFCQSRYENVLFVIDSIPMFNGYNHEGQNDITEHDIYKVSSTKDSDLLSKYSGYKPTEIVYVFTVPYSRRSDSLRKIPTRQKMIINNARFHLESASEAYTGPFIDYYVNLSLIHI